MANTQVYSTFKSYISRLHDVLNLRRKKTKPRLVISAPFDFKKEDSICILPGISDEELYVLREKAAASIVGSALTNAYADSGVMSSPSTSHDLNRSTSSFGKESLQNQRSHLTRSMTLPPAHLAQPTPTHHCRRCNLMNHQSHTKGGHGGVSGQTLTYSQSQRVCGTVGLYPPIVLASTEPYTPSGLSFPSSSSSASSITSSRDRD